MSEGATTRLKGSDLMILYRSKATAYKFIGPFDERQMQTWYREGYFYSEMEFRFDGREATFTLNQLRELNGLACPFSFVTEESHRSSTVTSDSAREDSIPSSMEIAPAPFIEDPPEVPQPLKKQQIIVTSRLMDDDAFQFATDVRLRMGENVASAIWTVKTEEHSCYFYPSSSSVHLSTLTREERSFDQIWRMKCFLVAKKPSLLAIMADRTHLFSVLSSVMEACKQGKLPLSHILIISTGSVYYSSDIKSISRYLERRNFERINTNDNSFRRFIKRSR